MAGTVNSAGLSLSGTSGNETLTGGSGNDTFFLISGDQLVNGLSVRNGLDTYVGGEGYDVVKGGGSVDYLNVTSNLSNLIGIEEVNGGDTATLYNAIVGTSGADSLDFSKIRVVDFMINGGAGADTITASTGEYHWGSQVIQGVILNGGAGNDVLTSGGGNDIFLLETGDTAVNGLSQKNGLDTFTGGAGYDVIRGGGSSDVLNVNSTLSNLNGIEEINGGDTLPEINTILGTSGADRLDFSAIRLVDFTVNAGAGDDALAASPGEYHRGAQVVQGVILDGGAGNDTLTGGAGGDVLTGGQGNDVFSLRSGESLFFGVSSKNGLDTISGGDGYDVIKGGGGADALLVTSNLSNLSGIEEINGGDTAFEYNAVFGTTGADTLNFGAIRVVDFMINGGPGADTIVAGSGEYHQGNQIVQGVVLVGGAGNDVLISGNGNDLFLLGAGDVNGLDSFAGGAGYDVIRGSGSADYLNVTSNLSNLNGIEEINGGDTMAEINVVQGTSGDDRLDFSQIRIVDFTIRSGAGADTVTATQSSYHVGAAQIVQGAILDGGAGNDVLTTGAGNDVFLLDTGDIASFGLSVRNGLDTYAAGAGYDVIKGGGSSDVLNVNSNLSNLGGIDEINGGDTIPEINTVLGTSGDDTLDFSRIRIVDFTVRGSDGNDLISASVGEYHRNGVLVQGVVLDGGAGNDTLIGGAGADMLTGGQGADRFVWTGGNDTIYDFVAGDKLDLTRLHLQNGINDLDITRSGAGWAVDTHHGGVITLFGPAGLSPGDFIF